VHAFVFCCKAKETALLPSIRLSEKNHLNPNRAINYAYLTFK
jgi:hypothetical protein